MTKIPNPIPQTADAVKRLSEGRARLLCFFLGALHIFAFAPFGGGPFVFFLTIPPLIWLLDARPSAKSAFFYGFFFGFAYFAVSLYWVAHSFLLDPVFFVLAPLAPLFLALLLAFFPAAALFLAALFWRQGWRRVPLLALAWTCSEILRAHILTGFPWNMAGQSFAASLPLMQSAAFVGVYGMSFLTILIAGSLAALGETKKSAFLAPLSALLLLLALYAGGQARLAGAAAGGEETEETAPIILIVQPNVPQARKWSRSHRQENIARHLLPSRDALSRASSRRRLLIWPESALPLLFDREETLRRRIASWMRPSDMLLTGALRMEGEGETRRAYNALLVMDWRGRIAARQDKVHLTPFGEYLPFQDFLESLGLRQLTRLRGGFTPGEERRVIRAQPMPPFAALICYEIVFPDEVPGTKTRPAFLVNVTNDGWFGVSPGPYQHLEQARLRAAENGLPLARAANTGVSAMIDPYGRLLSSLPLNEAGLIRAALPEALAPTFYALYGYSLPLLFLLAQTLLLVFLPVLSQISSPKMKVS